MDSLFPFGLGVEAKVDLPEELQLDEAELMAATAGMAELKAKL